MNRIPNIIFRLLILLIVSIGVLDIFLTVKHCRTICEFERNPVASWMITRERQLLQPDPLGITPMVSIWHTDVSLLVAFKSAGLCLTQMALGIVLDKFPKFAAPVFLPVAALQVCLFVFLMT